MCLPYLNRENEKFDMSYCMLTAQKKKIGEDKSSEYSCFLRSGSTGPQKVDTMSLSCSSGLNLKRNDSVHNKQDSLSALWLECRF